MIRYKKKRVNPAYFGTVKVSDLMEQETQRQNLIVIMTVFTDEYRALEKDAPHSDPRFKTLLDNFNALLASFKLHVQIDDGVLTCYALPGATLWLNLMRRMRTMRYKIGENGEPTWIEANLTQDDIYL